MKLVFKNTGSTAELAKWLKGFKEITNSVLIEIDLKTKEFIAKVSTDDHSLIRYSKISFEKAGLEFVSLDGVDEISSRIKVGIFLILSKFIDVINTFSEVDHTITFVFDECNVDGTTEYHSKNIEFKSKSLKMNVQDCNISEFVQISDELFMNKLYSIGESYTITVTPEIIKNLLSISSVFSVDPAQDVMEFYIAKDGKKWKFGVKDQTNKSYDYFLGDIEGCEEAVNFPIFRTKFVMATKGITDNMVFSLSGDSNMNRILLDSEDGNTKTVVAIVKS